MKALKSVGLFDFAVHVALLMSVISQELTYPSCMHFSESKFCGVAPKFAELKPGIACSNL